MSFLSSRITASDVSSTSTAIKSPPPHRVGRSSLLVLYLLEKTSELRVSGLNQISVNTITWKGKEKLSVYKLDSLHRKPLLF